MTTEHPITPPPELVEQWVRSSSYTEGMLYPEGYQQQEIRLATQAARWGADQELEACVEWLGDAPVTWNGDEEIHPGSYLRSARRPEPPSLKQQALEAVDALEGFKGVDTIRRALESLPD